MAYTTFDFTSTTNEQMKNKERKKKIWSKRMSMQKASSTHNKQIKTF